MFVDIGNVKDATRMTDHHKRQSAGIELQSAGIQKRYDTEPTFRLNVGDPIYMIPHLKSEKSLEDLLDDYVIFSEW